MRQCNRHGVYLLEEGRPGQRKWVFYSRKTGRTLLSYDVTTRRWEADNASGYQTQDMVLTFVWKLAAEEQQRAAVC